VAQGDAGLTALKEFVMTAFVPERTISILSRLSWRHLRGPADYRVLASIGQRANLADHVDDVLTVEALANELEHPVNFDPAEDVLIAELEGRPVAWQLTTWRLHDGQCHYKLAGYVSPGWRRRGIGRELLRRGERRLRAVAAGHPAGDERLLGTFSPAARQGKVALFEAEGYRAIRHFYTMLHTGLDDLPPAVIPAGFELRPVRPEHLRAIWDANEEAFRDHWGNTPRTEEDFERFKAQADFDPSPWQVAWHQASHQVAGVSINVILRASNSVHSRQRGRVDDLSVRRPWRKNGLGRALLLASLGALRGRGQTEVELGVDAENLTGALRLYEAVGFRPIDHAMVFTKPLELEP
jgi:mycothiol synthase